MLAIENTAMFSEENYVPPNPPIGSGDRVQTMLIITVFIVWWPWKLSQGHQNLINSLIIIPMIQYIKVDQNLSFGSRDRVHSLFFFGRIWHSKCWCDLENEVKVTKI